MKLLRSYCFTDDKSLKVQLTLKSYLPKKVCISIGRRVNFSMCVSNTESAIWKV